MGGGVREVFFPTEKLLFREKGKIPNYENLVSN
jgi:hypothetical protein